MRNLIIVKVVHPEDVRRSAEESSSAQCFQVHFLAKLERSSHTVRTVTFNVCVLFERF